MAADAGGPGVLTGGVLFGFGDRQSDESKVES